MRTYIGQTTQNGIVGQRIWLKLRHNSSHRARKSAREVDRISVGASGYASKGNISQSQQSSDVRVMRIVP
jgi:hypothetical protein